MSNRNLPEQQGMFVLTSRPAGGQAESTDLARWLYPCSVCNELDCEEAGAMCPACKKPRKRAASPRRTTNKSAIQAIRKASTRKTTPSERGRS